MAVESSDRRAISRREVLRRGAVIGGVLWASPVIQSFTNHAAAASPPPTPDDGGGGDQGAPGGGGGSDITVVSSSRAGRGGPGARAGAGEEEPSVLPSRLARTAQDPRVVGVFGTVLASIGAALRRLSRSTEDRGS